MPLAFHSTSHGTVAFGFFNVETDMLLLDRLFFFADRFCRAVVELSASAPRGPAAVRFEGHRLDDPALRGDLHGAIAGRDLSGLIGASYRAYPFPAREEDFRQNPLGHLTQAEMRAAAARFGQQVAIPIEWLPAEAQVAIGGYRFDPQGFAELVAYLDRGGMPRWRDGARPDYVVEMTRAVAGSWPWLRAPASR